MVCLCKVDLSGSQHPSHWLCEAPAREISEPCLCQVSVWCILQFVLFGLLSRSSLCADLYRTMRKRAARASGGLPFCKNLHPGLLLNLKFVLLCWLHGYLIAINFVLRRGCTACLCIVCIHKRDKAELSARSSPVQVHHQDTCRRRGAGMLTFCLLGFWLSRRCHISRKML